MKHTILLSNGKGICDSTLLIPFHYKRFFDEKVKNFGGVCKLFKYMVNSRHPMLNLRPVTVSGRTTYAPEGENLQRVNFRPRNEDWERFRIIAQSRRISMCFLFVILLMNWDEFEIGDSRDPALPNKIALLISQTTTPAFTRIKICRHNI